MTSPASVLEDNRPRTVPRALRALQGRPRRWMWALWWLLAGTASVRLMVAVHDLSAIDLHVYRRAALDVLQGASPYAPRHGLPFTYPPWAALLAVPLALVPERLANLGMASLGLIAAVLVAGVARRQVGLAMSAMWWIAPITMLLSPTWRTIELGQVNLILMAVVAVDAFLVPERHRGWLTGLAAGVKLVPAVFAGYYWATGQRHATARVALGLIGSVACGAVALPTDTIRYWFVLVRDPGRVGDVAYIDNVALRGLLARTTESGPVPLAVVLALAALLTYCSAARAHRRGDDLGALVAMAFLGLVASPVSWSHHWVWVAPSLLWLAANAKRSSRARCIAAIVLAVSAATPLEWEQRQPHVAGALTWSYLVMAVLVVSYAGRRATATNPSHPQADPATPRRDPEGAE